MNKERELLIQAIDACDACDDEKDAYYERLNNVFEEIRNYLICEPEDEPVAWIIGYQTMTGDIGKKLSWSKSAAEVCNRLQGEEYETPLYLHPAEPERKPMTEEEIDDESLRLDCFRKSFGLGVRCAEKHHGIGE